MRAVGVFHAFTGDGGWCLYARVCGVERLVWNGWDGY
jgi:hypothetical protein